jgi:hypothetical protein
MSKIVTITETTDADGVFERSSSVVTITKLPKEPDYIKLYIDDIGHLMGVQEGHRSILLYIAASVGYDGFVTLTLARKARIAATVGLAVKTVDNAIGLLVKTNILRREGRCEYELNPSLFAKGEWAHIRERRESFNLNVSYSKAGGRRLVGAIRTPPDVVKRETLEAQGQQRLEV